MPADLTTLLSKFLNALYAGTLYSNPFGATSVGLPVIQAVGRATAQVAANANVVTYTVGAADGSFEVSANWLSTVATTYSTAVFVAFTDESNTARTYKLAFTNSAGTYTINLVNTDPAGPYTGFPMQLRCKAGTTIVVSTSGTFTTVTYNVEAMIKQTA